MLFILPAFIDILAGSFCTTTVYVITNAAAVAVIASLLMICDSDC